MFLKLNLYFKLNLESLELLEQIMQQLVSVQLTHLLMRLVVKYFFRYNHYDFIQVIQWECTMTENMMTATQEILL